MVYHYTQRTRPRIRWPYEVVPDESGQVEIRPVPREGQWPERFLVIQVSDDRFSQELPMWEQLRWMFIVVRDPDSGTLKVKPVNAVSQPLTDPNCYMTRAEWDLAFAEHDRQVRRGENEAPERWFYT